MSTLFVNLYLSNQSRVVSVVVVIVVVVVVVVGGVGAGGGGGCSHTMAIAAGDVVY